VLESIDLSTLLRFVPDSLPCFPCLASKAPACLGGFKAASTNPDALRGLWRRYPGPLIGVPTGEPSGVAVLDLDTTKHVEAADWLANHRASLPVTRVHQTRSGGYHLLFRHQPGLRSNAGQIAAGIDVRAEGGYVIWWPAEGLPVWRADKLAAWPLWLATKPPEPVYASAAPTLPVSDRYASAALRRAVDRVAGACDGQRNSTLNAEAYALSRFIASGTLDVHTIAESLARAAARAGLTAAEITATLTSAMNAGVAQ
jgi:hypothetical protein